MQKLYILEEIDVYKIVKLYQRKHDQEYIILSTSSGEYADIAQYNDKYQNVHLATVKREKLLPENRY